MSAPDDFRDLAWLQLAEATGEEGSTTALRLALAIGVLARHLGRDDWLDWLAADQRLRDHWIREVVAIGHPSAGRAVRSDSGRAR